MVLMSIVGTILSNWAHCIEILVFTKVSWRSPHCDGASMKWGEKIVWKERKCEAVKRQFNEIQWIFWSRQAPKSHQWMGKMSQTSEVKSRWAEGGVGSTRLWLATSKKAGVSKKRRRVGGERGLFTALQLFCLSAHHFRVVYLLECFWWKKYRG